MENYAAISKREVLDGTAFRETVGPKGLFLLFGPVVTLVQINVDLNDIAVAQQVFPSRILLIAFDELKPLEDSIRQEQGEQCIGVDDAFPN